MSKVLKLPAPPAVEAPRQTSLDGLAPRFRAAVEAILGALKADGLDPVVFETTRTDARQQYLHGFGRQYDDGRGVVTYATDADETWHGYGLAVDIISANRGWSDMDFFRALHRACAPNGCTSGADWNKNGSTADETFLDWPHVQWGTLRRSPSPRAVRLVDTAGLPGLWQAVGAM